MFKNGKNRRNKLQNKRTEISQLDRCTCLQCNYTETHKRGVPCVSLLCPKCNIPLVRNGVSASTDSPSLHNKNSKKSTFPSVTTELCVGCGACVKVCPADAISIENGKAKIETEKCKNCRACVKVCKVNAIA